MSDAISRWLRDGQPALLSNRVFQARIRASATAIDVPDLIIQQVAGIPADAIGAIAAGSSWSADPRDTFAFSGSISWPSASLSCALSMAPAIAETGARDLASALASALGCETVGAHLAASNAETAVAWTLDCADDCETALCQNAVDSLLMQACAASDGEQSNLTLLATGSAEVGTNGAAESFNGSWVGRLTRGTERTATAGTVSGGAPRAF
jgi:hypothetical protein